MKHIYIIGNGFDIFTGLNTRYSDFRKWLEHNYIFVYENLKNSYDMSGDWWNDFEEELGNLDVERFIKRFTPPAKSFEEIQLMRKESHSLVHKLNLPPDISDTPCSQRLRGLLDILQYCFEKWVCNCQSVFDNLNFLKLELQNSYFISFNYTDTLEWLYKIPEERVLHIHGRASKHEHLVFGHGHFCLNGGSLEKDNVYSVLNRYQKNPYEYIFKHEELQEIIKEAQYVHVYGLSLSDVDKDYLEWLYENTLKSCQWEFSWFSDKDKNRIEAFKYDHYDLKDRVTLIQLQEIEEKKALQSRKKCGGWRF